MREKRNPLARITRTGRDYVSGFFLEQFATTFINSTINGDNPASRYCGDLPETYRENRAKRLGAATGVLADYFYVSSFLSSLEGEQINIALVSSAFALGAKVLFNVTDVAVNYFSN